METITEVVGRLGQKGYTGQFRAESGGLRYLGTDTLFQPEELQVEEMVRLEGTSAPDEETVVFAISTPDAERATYCVNYGPNMDPADMSAVSRLQVHTARHS